MGWHNFSFLSNQEAVKQRMSELSQPLDQSLSLGAFGEERSGHDVSY